MSYGVGFGNQCCSGGPSTGGYNTGVGGFALIVVLFILLIIVGKVWC